ncbi:hypothetical protein [Micromonospora sp. NPDC005174]
MSKQQNTQQSSVYGDLSVRTRQQVAVSKATAASEIKPNKK